MPENEGKTKLKDYLDYAGILLCNVNPQLPSLSDIGCRWRDATDLIDDHGLFYCKAYRKRTSYLSGEAYFLLKQCRRSRPLKGASERLYKLIKEAGALETDQLKSLAGMEGPAFTKAFDFLLENLYVTAFRNGRILNPNWSTFVYITAEAWEEAVEKPFLRGEPWARLQELLLKTMPLPELEKLVK
jgi:hypothetical protein